MFQPEILTKDEFLFWLTGKGTDVDSPVPIVQFYSVIIRSVFSDFSKHVRFVQTQI